jgi:hypothetical protein
MMGNQARIGGDGDLRGVLFFSETAPPGFFRPRSGEDFFFMVLFPEAAMVSPQRDAGPFPFQRTIGGGQIPRLLA